MIATIIILALIFMELGANLVKNGEPKTGYYSFGLSLFSNGILVFLLWKAGLFENFK